MMIYRDCILAIFCYSFKLVTLCDGFNSLQEECLLSICSQTMSDQNGKTTLAFQNFSNSLDRTATYLSLLAAQSM